MLRRLPSWVLGLYTLLAVVSAALIGLGASGGLTGGDPDPAFIAVGILGFIVVAAAFPLVVVQFRPVGQKVRPLDQASVASGGQMDVILRSLQEIRDLATLREEIKTVLFSNRERTILRALVDQALAARHYPAAESLVRAIEDELGYQSLAAECRARIDQMRYEENAGHADVAMTEFEACLARHDWGGAYQEAAKIRTFYSDPDTAAHLDDRVREAREGYKNHLEAAFHDATSREDIDTAMNVLRELDRYMTRDEAARLKVDAESIIQLHRDRLGLSFQLAMQEKRWADAARVGTTIMDEFPNSKMANEVGSMIDVLRTRATEEAVAASS